MGADRVELYTEPFARAFERGPDAGAASFEQYARGAGLAHELGLGVNAGHDLDLRNLTLFKTLPHLDEVSIGHALISHALFVGLRQSVRDYLAAVDGRMCDRDARSRGRAAVAALLLSHARRGSGRPRVTLPSADGVDPRRRSSTKRRLAPRLASCSCTCCRAPRTIGRTLRRAAAGRRHHGAGHRPARPRRLGRIASAARRRWCRTCGRRSQWLATRARTSRPDAIGVVGASLGANLALLAAADLPLVRAIALLSPSLDYRGLRTRRRG